MAETRPLVGTYGLYIDGQWADPENGRYDDICPSTGATIASAPDASLARVEGAIVAARQAFDSGRGPVPDPRSEHGVSPSSAARC